VAILAEDLCKAFAGGRVRALQRVSICVQPGEWVAVTGPTGSGKSTLLSVLALLDSPDEGRLELDGIPAERLGPGERWRANNVGIVFQLHHLLTHLTVVENVALPLVRWGTSWREARRLALKELEAVGLAERAETVASQVSGGERQLAAVARALAARPRLVLADEPTGNVDPATGQRIVDLLDGWRRQAGATLLTVTHQPDLATRADRVIHLVAGRIAEGPAADARKLA
jgi:predicted ABC-type transport system involved in lysophospholipase L1 biosynthesis ATPase subunit